MANSSVYILNRDLDLVAVIDDYEELEWQRSDFGIGSFTLTMDKSQYNPSYIRKGYTVLMADPSNTPATAIQHPYMIEQIELMFDATGRESEVMIASGRSVGGILEERLVLPDPGMDYHTMKGNAEHVLKHYVDENGGPNTKDPARIIPNLIIAPSSNRGPTVYYRARYNYVSDILKELSNITGFGWEVTFNPTTKKFVFDIIPGRDYRDGQPNAVIFDVNLETANSQRWITTDFDRKTFAYVTNADPEINDDGTSCTCNIPIKRFHTEVMENDAVDFFLIENEQYDFELGILSNVYAHSAGHLELKVSNSSNSVIEDTDAHFAQGDLVDVQTTTSGGLQLKTSTYTKHTNTLESFDGDILTQVEGTNMIHAPYGIGNVFKWVKAINNINAHSGEGSLTLASKTERDGWMDGNDAKMRIRIPGSPSDAYNRKLVLWMHKSAISERDYQFKIFDSDYSSYPTTAASDVNHWAQAITEAEVATKPFAIYKQVGDTLVLHTSNTISATDTGWFQFVCDYELAGTQKGFNKLIDRYVYVRAFFTTPGTATGATDDYIAYDDIDYSYDQTVGGFLQTVEIKDDFEGTTVKLPNYNSRPNYASTGTETWALSTEQKHAGTKSLKAIIPAKYYYYYDPSPAYFRFGFTPATDATDIKVKFWVRSDIVASDSGQLGLLVNIKNDQGSTVKSVNAFASNNPSQGTGSNYMLKSTDNGSWYEVTYDLSNAYFSNSPDKLGIPHYLEIQVRQSDSQQIDTGNAVYIDDLNLSWVGSVVGAPSGGVGTRVSPAYGPLASGEGGSKTRVDWEAVIPAGTEIVMEAAITDSNSVKPENYQYQVIQQSGNPIPQAEGQDINGKYLWLRYTLRTGQGDLTPIINKVVVYFDQTYLTSGYRISSLDLTSVGTNRSSIIEWAVDEPQGTSVKIETRINNGSWTQVGSGDVIPGLTPGQNLANVTLDIRQSLATTAPKTTPKLLEMSVFFNKNAFPEPTGFDRREVFVEAGGEKTTVARSLKGDEKLRSTRTPDTFETVVNPDGAFKYRQHWDIGDTVTVSNSEWGIRKDTRIVGVKYAANQDGYDLSVALGNPLPTLKSNVQREIERTTSKA